MGGKAVIGTRSARPFILNKSVGLMDQCYHIFNCKANHLKVNIFSQLEHQNKVENKNKQEVSSNNPFFFTLKVLHGATKSHIIKKSLINSINSIYHLS